MRVKENVITLAMIWHEKGKCPKETLFTLLNKAAGGRIHFDDEVITCSLLISQQYLHCEQTSRFKGLNFVMETLLSLIRETLASARSLRFAYVEMKIAASFVEFISVDTRGVEVLIAHANKKPPRDPFRRLHLTCHHLSRVR